MLPYVPASVAELLLQGLDEAAVLRGQACLAIPGGRSPGPVLTALAGMCTPFVRERLHLYWLDERAVPRRHADRNDAPTLAAWEAGGPLPAAVHPMPAEDLDLESAAAAYAKILPARLDACLIGLGEDGHLASLFPDHPGLGELSPVFVVRDSPKPPSARLTLSLAVIAAARQRAVLCLGAAKGWCWTRFRAGPARGCPASLLPMADTVWYLDDAAVLAAVGSADPPR